MYQKGNKTRWIAIAKNFATMKDWEADPSLIEWVCGCPEELNVMFSKETDTRNPICKPGPIDVVTGISGSVDANGAFDTEDEMAVYLFENECKLENALVLTVDTVLSGLGDTTPMTKEPIVHLFEGVPSTEFPASGGSTREFTLGMTNCDYICNISQDYIPECLLANMNLAQFVTLTNDAIEVPIDTVVDEAYLVANAGLRYSGFGLEVTPTFTTDPSTIDTSIAGVNTYVLTYTSGALSASATIEITVI